MIITQYQAEACLARARELEQGRGPDLWDRPISPEMFAANQLSWGTEQLFSRDLNRDEVIVALCLIAAIAGVSP